MSSAKKTVKVKKVNRSQPSFLLKEKQSQKVRALLAEKKRQNEMRRQFENFMKSYRVPNNNNNYMWNNLHKKKGTRRATRKLRR